MNNNVDVLCIGAALWDIIGWTDSTISIGDDKPGKIIRKPGGVAFNIAKTLAQFGKKPALISAVGKDIEGTALLEYCNTIDIATEYMIVHSEYSTDQYVAIEEQGRLIVALADTHLLETVGTALLAPFSDGRLGNDDSPYRGLCVIDGNLIGTVLQELATNTIFSKSDLRIASASPSKVKRLASFFTSTNAILYLNLEEARNLVDMLDSSAEECAHMLLAQGIQRTLITDGAHVVVDANTTQIIRQNPPQVKVQKITGAGDTFMAAHIVAETSGANRVQALDYALSETAKYIGNTYERTY